MRPKKDNPYSRNSSAQADKATPQLVRTLEHRDAVFEKRSRLGILLFLERTLGVIILIVVIRAFEGALIFAARAQSQAHKHEKYIILHLKLNKKSFSNCKDTKNPQLPQISRPFHIF